VAKRGRPDFLTAICFSPTRVQKSIVEDFKKLSRMGAYLNSTKDLKPVRVSANEDIKIHAFVDASYGVHVDGKSHTSGTDT